LIRSLAVLSLLSACSSLTRSDTLSTPSSVSTSEITYESADLRHVIVFAEDGAHFGPPLEFSPETPPPPTRFIEPGSGIRCVSIGLPGNTDDFAIQRPIRLGRRYQCGTTRFEVIRCFENCRAAVIEREWRAAANQPSQKTYMYVDSCAGVVAFSQSNDLSVGIPPDAEFLRGPVGILADRNHEHCRR
jgi:hypothetical protein